jgi:hypothetical protein
MATWTSDELNRIGTADELQIAAYRSTGALRKAVTIWVVRLGDDLYVRSVKGHNGAWFRGVLESHAGRIQADGIDKDVSFVEETAPGLNDQIDAAYHKKYRRYPSSIDHIVSPEARTATIKLVPASKGL